MRRGALRGRIFVLASLAGFCGVLARPLASLAAFGGVLARPLAGLAAFGGVLARPLAGLAAAGGVFPGPLADLAAASWILAIAHASSSRHEQLLDHRCSTESLVA